MDATQSWGWGGVGHVNVSCKLHALWMLRNPGFGVGRGMLTFHVIACAVDATQSWGWGRVGHVNVPCNLHALWMLRNPGVGAGWGMLTFHVTCMRCGC